MSGTSARTIQSYGPARVGSYHDAGVTDSKDRGRGNLAAPFERRRVKWQL